jgi:hypothetical protein
LWHTAELIAPVVCEHGRDTDTHADTLSGIAKLNSNWCGFESLWVDTDIDADADTDTRSGIAKLKSNWCSFGSLWVLCIVALW